MTREISFTAGSHVVLLKPIQDQGEITWKGVTFAALLGYLMNTFPDAVGDRLRNLQFPAL
jgi:hypothetical protein